jgi:hypothetical protein
VIWFTLANLPKGMVSAVTLDFRRLRDGLLRQLHLYQLVGCGPCFTSSRSINFDVAVAAIEDRQLVLSVKLNFSVLEV